MLFKAKAKNDEGEGLDEYFIEADTLSEAAGLALQQAEENYQDRPITITNIETVSYSKVIRKESTYGK